MALWMDALSSDLYRWMSIHSAMFSGERFLASTSFMSSSVIG